MLGVDAFATYESTSFTLQAEDMFALFTDGYIEEQRDIEVGNRRLHCALRHAAGTLDPAAHVHGEIFGAKAPRDDTALLLVSVEAKTASLDLILPARPEAAATARAALRRFLASFDIGDDRRSQLVVGVGEAIVNAIEHGNRGDAATFRLIGSRLSNAIVIEVESSGRWHENVPAVQRGYGLPLMHAFANTVTIERRADSTRVRLASILP